jgi:hypothetical protein
MVSRSQGETMIEFIEPIEVDEPQEPLPIFIGLVFGAVVTEFSFVWAALYFLN